MRLTDIRSKFLDYFVSQGHTLVPSSPLVPKNDPTLMFTAAGMVQFKDVFTGLETRDYRRATSSQKCLRAGGKHNDLDNVGYTARHHTFFEMLGNFSFGDYFKEEAIFYAWDLVTKEFGLDPSRLLVTVYSEDEEAETWWRKITGFSHHKIIRIPTSDNFWSAGDTGPCGPCTEIFFDHGEGVEGGPPGSPNQDGDRFVEIWNLVFMQFEKLADGRQISLPQPSVDTGMGLERIGAVLQGVQSNFETDLFRHIIEASKALTHNPSMQQSHQVIADHLRACCFLLADGVLPSNEGRGYVLRRIMRRAMRHAHLLGEKDPLIYRLVPALLDVMGEHYPELGRAQPLITATLKQEEEKFLETLGRGIKLLQDEVVKLPKGAHFPGEVAFRLYDTYGFPVDLTEDVLRSMRIQLDKEAFDRAMEAQRDTARASWVGSGESKSAKIWFDVLASVGPTEFLGYTMHDAQSVVGAIVLNGQSVKIIKSASLSPQDELFIVCPSTPFYGASGGQMGDRGSIVGSNFKANIKDCTKPLEGLIVHHLTNPQGELSLGDSIRLHVDMERRRGLRQHHSATHLLHRALRELLGEHVIQKGSLVEENRLRFDFTHTKVLSDDEMNKVEDLVNASIQKNKLTHTEIMSQEKAIEAGAMALFGEKYGDNVRVVRMDDSIELCGGTHVHATGDIGVFKIISESGIAAGVRRIEAVVGMTALDYIRSLEMRQKEIAKLLKVSPAQLMDKLTRLLEEQKSLRQEIINIKGKLALGGATADAITTIGNVRLLVRHLEGHSAKDLKGIMDEMKKTVGSGIALLTNVSDGKINLLLGVSGDATSLFNASELIQKISPFIGGKGGGGRIDLAQAGGSETNGLSKVVEALKEAIAELQD